MAAESEPSGGSKLDAAWTRIIPLKAKALTEKSIATADRGGGQTHGRPR
jgi:hypothetical protein